MDFSILSSFLPEGLLDHFDIIDFKELGDLQTKKECFFVYLDEKNNLPEDYNSNEFEYKLILNMVLPSKDGGLIFDMDDLPEFLANPRKWGTDVETKNLIQIKK